MVKVTFNSALAQKEAKKDEPKSSEEALIAPPDAVAVDCKVLARVVGGVPAAGTGVRTVLRSRVPWCVCAAGGAGSWPWRPPRGQLHRCTSSRGFALGSVAWEPAATGTATTEFGTFLPV